MFDVDGAVSKAEADNINPVVLAFIGDAVYTLFVREKLAEESDLKSGELNKRASGLVCAKAQAERAKILESEFTEEEKDVFRRARNAKKGTRAKSATVAEYNLSTALEAVFGYLQVTGKRDRLNYLFNYKND